MTKRIVNIILLSTLFFSIVMLLRAYFSSNQTVISPERPKVEISPEKIEIDGRKVVGLTAGKEKEEIQKIKIANKPTKDWEPELEKTLRAQGGDSLKEVSFNKVDSFIWANDGIALYVESVIVKIKNNKNAVTSFRVLVDSQTGKILQNWDRPVYDPLNPKDRFRITIDPARFHSDQ